MKAISLPVNGEFTNDRSVMSAYVVKEATAECGSYGHGWDMRSPECSTCNPTALERAFGLLSSEAILDKGISTMFECSHEDGTLDLCCIRPACNSLEGAVNRIRASLPPPTLADQIREALLTRDQLRDLAQPEPLIENTLDRNTTAVLAGYTGTGKTFIALAWACCVATGTPWQGRPVKAGRVLFVAAEGAEGLDARIAAWETHHGVSVGENLGVLPFAVNLTAAAAVAAIVEVATGLADLALVVVDTLARSIVGADENSAKDVGLAVDASEQMRRLTTACVLLVHHAGKDRAGIRGSSALEAGVNTVYTTEGDERHLVLRRTKRKEGPREDEHHFYLEAAGESAVIRSHGGPMACLEMQQSEVDLMRVSWDLCGTDGLSPTDLREAAGMSKSTYFRAQKVLVSRGQLRNVGTEKRPRYVPVEDTR